jgi:hypothetical protein
MASAGRRPDDVSMDEALDAAFFVFHTTWIAFNCLGWMWRRTRPWHLWTVALTGLSWFGLGLWYGWGYCPCTDWHWQVRARLGHQDPDSYLQLLAREVLGLEVGRSLADGVAVATLGATGVLSIVLHVRDRRQSKERR